MPRGGAPHSEGSMSAVRRITGRHALPAYSVMVTLFAHEGRIFAVFDLEAWTMEGEAGILRLYAEATSSECFRRVETAPASGASS